MLQLALALLGIVVVVVAIVLGLVTGEVDRSLNDAGFKDEIEKRKKERERQKAWKDKWK